MKNNDLQPLEKSVAMHWPCLILGLLIMLAGTFYPLLFADSQGRADHQLALLLFWAMAAGFVRGIGFIPRFGLLRWLFSGWAALLAILLALLIKFTD